MLAIILLLLVMLELRRLGAVVIRVRALQASDFGFVKSGRLIKVDLFSEAPSTLHNLMSPDKQSSSSADSITYRRELLIIEYPDGPYTSM